MVGRILAAYDAREHTQKRVRAVIATRQFCGHRQAYVNVEALPKIIVVPETGQRLGCSQCRGKRIDTIRWVPVSAKAAGLGCHDAQQDAAEGR